jgi:hypothetical protein
MIRQTSLWPAHLPCSFRICRPASPLRPCFGTTLKETRNVSTDSEPSARRHSRRPCHPRDGFLLLLRLLLLRLWLHLLLRRILRILLLLQLLLCGRRMLRQGLLRQVTPRRSPDRPAPHGGGPVLFLTIHSFRNRLIQM